MDEALIMMQPGPPGRQALMTQHKAEGRARSTICEKTVNLELASIEMAGTKRKHAHDSPDELYSSSSRSRPSVEARVDPTYGQRSAIPLDEDGGSDEGNGELSYNDEMDAIAYLRSVRREAFGIPNLLVAPKANLQNDSRDIYEDGTGDYRGKYEDGAFFAPEADSDSLVENEDAPQDTLAAYYDAVLVRYHDLRLRLQVIPPLEAVQLLDGNRPTSVERLPLAKVKWWRWKMRTINPVPAQVASMDKDTVLRLLTVLTGGTLLKRGSEIDFAVSRWAWSLLARLPERGELTSEEIGVVRELGKKAVLVGVGLKEEKDWEEGIQEVEAEYEEDGEGDEHDEEADNSHAMSVVEDGDLERDEYDGLDGTPPVNEANISTPQSLPLNAETATHEDVATPPGDLENTGGNNLEEGSVSRMDEDELSAAKARMLNLLEGSSKEIGVTPPSEIITENSPPVKVSNSEAQNPETHLAKLNTKATVDMIITVAGEVYGQRDLLEFRSQWTTL